MRNLRPMANEITARIGLLMACRWSRVGVLGTAACLMAMLLGCGGKGSGREFPRKPIKVIVPFGAGGGSDTFTRIIQRAVEKNELLPAPLVVINVPGASGTIGSRRAKNARADGYTILQLHEGILTSKYSGNAPFGPEAFSPIAGTGEMSHVIAVRDDSSYKSILDLTSAAAEEPHSIVFAVGIGAPSHYAGLMLEKAAGDAKFQFTQSGGGAKRFASLLGGHTDVTTFSLAEFLEFRSSGPSRVGDPQRSTPCDGRRCSNSARTRTRRRQHEHAFLVGTERHTCRSFTNNRECVAPSYANGRGAAAAS